MRRQTEQFERGVGAGELLGFLLVVAISAWAFLYVGSSSTPSVARVVSMHDTVALGDRTGSIAPAGPESGSKAESGAPIPTPRPD